MSKIGICFGGYCPLHRGHLDLIMKSKKENDLTYIFVCGYDNEPRGKEIGLTLDQRFKIIDEMFRSDPLIEVKKINDTELGIDESMSSSNWDIWLNAVYKELPRGHKTFYVAEPSYKVELSNRHIPAILIPKINGISGTLIRKNLLGNWRYIADPFRKHLQKKILITGTASEGKSTLAQDIRTYFGIKGTEEYGRLYMEEKGLKDTDLSTREFITFIEQQTAWENKLREEHSDCPILICDTDNLVTLMYAKAYINDPDVPGIDQGQYDILHNLVKPTKWDRIFIIRPHGKFVDDGTRYMKQSSIEERNKNFSILGSLIDEFGYRNKVVELEGTYEENFEMVKNYINSLGV